MVSKAEFLKALEEERQSVRGKRVLITGGTTGIGRATALLLAAHDARVLIFGRHEPELESAMRDLRDMGGEAHGLIADVTSEEDIRRVFAEVDARLGGLDILINNAALPARSVLEDDYAHWEYVVKANLLGYLACSRLAVDRMRANGGGQIINIGSMSAVKREGGSSLYVATKSAVQGFTEALRKEANNDGIRVVLIEPGLVGTDLNDVPPPKQQEMEADMRMLKAEDIAVCIHFILTEPQRVDMIVVQVRPHLQII
ncbi:MAG: SDR family oxidoreductase [Chloroflexi bacterium]|nr:SDR family oxidoreductase [Chloroflexota bacterium]